MDEQILKARRLRRDNFRTSLAVDTPEVKTDAELRLSIFRTNLLVSETLDDFLLHRIETDKVIVGLLQDIRAGQQVET